MHEGTWRGALSKAPPIRRWLAAAELLVLLGVLTGCQPPEKPRPVPSFPKLVYPQPPRADVVDDYHGQQVPDPFRPLEDTASPQTRAWIEAENRLTEEFLAAAPGREAIRRRLTELWNFEKFGLPEARGGRYFYTRNGGLDNQPTLYVQDGLDGTPRPLVNPQDWAADGTAAFSGWEPSPDGKLLAYGLAMAGSDWQVWRVRDVETGQDLPELLEWIKFSGVSWLPDGSGFYYSRYDRPDDEAVLSGTNYYQKLFFHRIGDSQDQDTLAYERPDEKEWGFDGRVTEDGRYLVITVWRGAERKNCVFYRDLTVPDSAVVELITGFDAEYDFVANEGSTLFIRTDQDAPRGRLTAIVLASGDDPARRYDVIEETHKAAEVRLVLEAVTRVGDRFFARYLADARSLVRTFDLDGSRLGEVQLPGLGTALGFSGRADARETFYSFANFSTPATIYRYDLDARTSSVFRQPQLAFDPARYRVEQRFYPSRDGTEIPLFLACRADARLPGNQPCLLYGYGGFNIPLTPSFSVQHLVWMELGGLFALANLRGGGEYGREWHEAGMRFRKQNVFDDFQAAARYLVGNGFTSTRQLAITGRSNGGLLVGACLTQAPFLYGAAVPGVGVMDMLRFHKFTIGWGWVGEYGSADNPRDFANLITYSPLHNLKPGSAYPPTFVTTADHDDRVVPGHSFKFAAALQAAQAGPAPVLIRIETSAGHGAGISTEKAIAESTDVLTFLTRVFGMAVDEPR